MARDGIGNREIDNGLTEENGMDKQIIVYKSSDGNELPVKTDGETVWLTQEQMCKLFGRTQPVIARHIANIFKEGELEKEVVYAKFAYTTRHGAIAGKTRQKMTSSRSRAA